MLGVWQEMLRLEQIGTRDNLFDLGANSFLMVQANGRLRAALGKPVSLVDMFRFPTIGALAAHLGDAASDQDDAAEEGQQRAAARKDAMAAAPRSAPARAVTCGGSVRPVRVAHRPRFARACTSR